jgi:hypothetical protein
LLHFGARSVAKAGAKPANIRRVKLLMISTVKAIIDLLQKNEPATAAEMESFRNTCPVDLPKDYLEFAEYSNGAAGSFPNGNHIILWRIERLVERNRAYEVEDYAPGIFVFASSGGGEAYGFDTRSSMAVIQIPFVGMQLSEVEYLVPSFTEFLTALAGDGKRARSGGSPNDEVSSKPL